MTKKRAAFARAAAALLALLMCAAPCLAETADLTADSMTYDPKSGAIEAFGDVHIRRPDGEIWGDTGRGSARSSVFELEGNVAGWFAPPRGDDPARDDEPIMIECNFIRTTEAPGGRQIFARGDVGIVRSPDNVRAQAVSWDIGLDRYEARGGVMGGTAEHFLDADAAGRDGDDFWATGVRRYVNSARHIKLSADRVDGVLKRGSMIELVADGDVEIELPDKEGNMLFVSGRRGIYSLARGTIVMSGGASASQSGRDLQAGSIVYWLDSGKVEALERPTITFDLE